MPQPTLFVCQSCHSSEERPDDQPADGAQLLEQLHTLQTGQEHPANLTIQAVECLWTCDKPCAVALSAPHKPTYVFTGLPTDETAAALLQFGQRYLARSTGDVPWKQFPEALQSASIAKIPAAGERGDEDTGLRTGASWLKALLNRCFHGA
ncbi:MAG: DUF1636 family protein [Nodosilinea sp.]